MGYLTTFTIYNDGIDLIKKDSDKFCEKLYQAACSQQVKNIGHGCFANLVQVQKTRHADDHTVYVHMGNCVTEMNAWSKETQSLMKSHPDFFSAMLRFMEIEVKELRKKFKEMKENKP